MELPMDEMYGPLASSAGATSRESAAMRDMTDEERAAYTAGQHDERLATVEQTGAIPATLPTPRELKKHAKEGPLVLSGPKEALAADVASARRRSPNRKKRLPNPRPWLRPMRHFERVNLLRRVEAGNPIAIAEEQRIEKAEQKAIEAGMSQSKAHEQNEPEASERFVPDPTCQEIADPEMRFCQQEEDCTAQCQKSTKRS